MLNSDENNRILPVLIISLTVIIAGCTNGAEEELGDSPIQINELELQPNPAPAEQTVNLRAQLENTGGNDAENVYMYFFGPPFNMGDTDNPERTWQSRTGGALENASRTMSFGNVEAATETAPSQPRTDNLDFLTPSLADGRNIDYNFNGRLQYTYETDGETEITIMGSERQQEVGTVPRQPSIEYSEGPLSMEVQGTTPHIVYGDTSTNDNLCFTITNEGPGETFRPGLDNDENDKGYRISDDEENSIELTIEHTGQITFIPEEESIDGGSDDSFVSIDVPMVNGEGYPCFEMDVQSGNIQDIETTETIFVEARYGYEEEHQTHVTVEGRGDLDRETREPEEDADEDLQDPDEDDLEDADSPD